jgi:invasion protein IalB
MKLLKTALIPALMLLSSAAAAQQPSQEVTRYKDWTLLCAQSQCMIQQVLVNPQTQAPIMSVMVAYSVKIKTNPLIVFNLPASTNPKELLTLKIDASDQMAIPDIRCDTQVCSAIANFTPDLAGQFQKGSAIAVTFPLKDKRLGLQVSLNGFGAAYKALVARHSNG